VSLGALTAGAPNAVALTIDARWLLVDARWLLAVARVAPVAVIAPPFGFGRSVGLRVAIAGMLVALVAPALPSSAAPSLAWRELLVGLALGVIAAVPFAAAQAAGLLVDRARDPDGRGPLGTLFGLLALALFAAMNGPRLLVVALVQSYVAFPVGAELAPGAGAAIALDAGAQLVGAGLTLAAPALAAVVLVELAVGFVARAQPALEGAIEASSLRTLAVVIVLSLGALALASGMLGDGGLRGLAGAFTDGARGLAR